MTRDARPPVTSSSTLEMLQPTVLRRTQLNQAWGERGGKGEKRGEGVGVGGGYLLADTRFIILCTIML